MPIRSFSRLGFSLLLILFLDFGSLARALEPDQIALVVNSNVPQCKKLAEFYAQQRHIPASHIIELSLNENVADRASEDISSAEYEEKAAPICARVS